MRARARASGASRSICRDEMRVLPHARTHASERFAQKTVQNAQACRGYSLDFQRDASAPGRIRSAVFFRIRACVREKTFCIDFGKGAVFVKKRRTDHKVDFVAVRDLLLIKQDVNIKNKKTGEKSQVEISVYNPRPTAKFSSCPLYVNHFVYLVALAQRKAFLNKDNCFVRLCNVHDSKKK